jgi:hypothetical protein
VKYVFPALKARFHQSGELRRVGRELFQGFDNQRLNVVPPYTEVNGRIVSRPNTFESDVEVWDLTFRYHAKDIRSNAAADWIEAMQAAFKDANITSFAFHCAGCEAGEASAPTSENSTFNAMARFRLTVQRRINQPLVRYA